MTDLVVMFDGEIEKHCLINLQQKWFDIFPLSAIWILSYAVMRYTNLANC